MNPALRSRTMGDIIQALAFFSTLFVCVCVGISFILDARLGDAPAGVIYTIQVS